MHRIVIIFFVILLPEFLIGQVEYPNDKIKLLAVVDPNKDSIYTAGGFKYSGCWGWYQKERRKEYALIGGTNGTYFIDITNPKAPIICDYVQGKNHCLWREIKTYNNYCYVVTECQEGLKIIDMKYLPDSVHVVSTGTNVLTNSHTIWIDGNKLYCGSLKIGPGNYAGMSVFSLMNPELPVFLRSVNSDYSFVGAHDMFSRRDTIYASSGGQLYILKYDSVVNKFIMLGSYVNYSKQGYNHSNFLTENGKYLVFCDEIPAAVPIHLVDVTNLENIQPASEFLPYPLTTPHNPYILGNDWAIISCYEDGLHIYDISDPNNVKHAGFFDTYPQSGFLQGFYTGGYTGNWGAYPFLPSKTIIATDMINGAFFLDASEAFAKSQTAVLTAQPAEIINDCAVIYTIPASKFIQVKAKAQNNGKIILSTPEGKTLYVSNYSEDLNERINTENMANGFYILSVGGSDCKVTKKILITHID